MNWEYQPATDLDQSLVERLRRFPREPDMAVYALRSVAAFGLRAWLRAFHRFEIVGLENLPKNESFVLVANHSSHLDTLCLLSTLPLRKLHRVFPAAAQDYFFVSAPRTCVAAIVVNALPFGRQSHIRQSLELCRSLLSNPGNVLILFPEGTRTTTGELGSFKPGIGLLVAGSDLPIVPCYLSGAFEAWPKGKWVPRPRKLRLHIGKPRVYSNLTTGKESAQHVCNDLREAVNQLRYENH